MDCKMHKFSLQFNISEIGIWTLIDAILQLLSARWQSQLGGGKILY